MLPPDALILNGLRKLFTYPEKTASRFYGTSKMEVERFSEKCVTTYKTIQFHNSQYHNRDL
jgi:hypothetical protein